MKKAIFFLWCGVLLCLSSFQLKEHHELTPEELGRLLFEDKRLSADRSISCASCHIPAFAFGDTTAVSVGVGGQKGSRNTPAITNMAARTHFFWDGRATSLEQQVLRPIENPLEMALPLDEAIARLGADAQYLSYFQKIYGRQPDTTALADALAAFVRTLETADTPFDRWMRGDTSAMSEAAIRGHTIFMEKGKCFECHFGPDFTGDEFRNIGLFNGKDLNDPGRFAITRDSADIGRFKVPGLRNVAVSAPYMHHGAFRTLREVIDYYDNPDRFVPNSIGRDSLLSRPLNLTDREKSDLEAFLHALTDDRFKR
ncbi:MAG: cytochrome-c peroxidase [Saprospiraceae bacterium]|nr:cytochrome-c peroxidase [Saprospiraceae bacterium]MDW8482808.1 cytochrome c peroxidase [Saprospiraceae bacterium]